MRGWAKVVLLFDVGNTHTVAGLTENGLNFVKWRLATQRYETEDELYSHLSTLLNYHGVEIENIRHVVVASVVPSLNHVFSKFAMKYANTSVVWVQADQSSGIQWDVDNPSEIGADRVANAIAAVQISENCIVIDFGTAITIDIIEKRSYKGGAILPGLTTSAHSLFEKTAKLPQVDLSAPLKCIGSNTADNIKIGIVKGTAYAVNGLVKEVKEALRNDPIVILTGGQSKIIQKLIRYDLVEQNLTLRGMYTFLKNACTLGESVDL